MKAAMGQNLLFPSQEQYRQKDTVPFALTEQTN